MVLLVFCEYSTHAQSVGRVSRIHVTGDSRDPGSGGDAESWFPLGTASLAVHV
jgi:hypothetical protein